MRINTLTASTSLLGFIALAGGLTACQSNALTPPPRMVVPALTSHAVPSLPVDVEHYAIDLLVDPVARAIDGTCKLRFSAGMGELNTVNLSLEGLRVHSVSDSAGRDLAFFQEAGTLSIVLSELVSR